MRGNDTFLVYFFQGGDVQVSVGLDGLWKTSPPACGSGALGREGTVDQEIVDRRRETRLL